MCLIRYQHLEQCQRTGGGKPMSLGHSPRTKLQPLWWGSMFTLPCAFADWKYSWIPLSLFIDHPAALPSTNFFHQPASQKVYSRWSWGPLQPGTLWFCDSRWYLIHSPSPFPACFSGTQLISVWCRGWQSTQARVPQHGTMSQSVLTPRYSLGCLWLIRC